MHRLTAGYEYRDAGSRCQQHGGGHSGCAVQAERADQRQVAAGYLAHTGAGPCQPLKLRVGRGASDCDVSRSLALLGS